MLPSDLQKLLHVAAVAKSLGLFSGERSGPVNIDVQTASKGVVSPLCGMEAPAFDETFDSATAVATLTLARHVDSCAGQVALRSHYLRGGDHAPQVPQVSACPVHSLKSPTSHGARARLTRLSQAAVASDIARVVTLMQPLNGLLVCNGSAALRDEPQHLERLQSGGVTWPGRAVEDVVRRWHVGSVAWPVCATLLGPRLRLCTRAR